MVLKKTENVSLSGFTFALKAKVKFIHSRIWMILLFIIIFVFKSSINEAYILNMLYIQKVSKELRDEDVSHLKDLYQRNLMAQL